jgi:hypothetical protein
MLDHQMVAICLVTQVEGTHSVPVDATKPSFSAQSPAYSSQVISSHGKAHYSVYQQSLSG